VVGGLVNFDARTLTPLTKELQQAWSEKSLFVRAAMTLLAKVRVSDRAGGQVVATDFGAH